MDNNAVTFQGLKIYTPARYRIRVKGVLDPSWSDWLGGMIITTNSQGSQTPNSTLIGPLADQAALLGVLNTLYDYYHYPLISVEYLGSA